MSRHRLKNLSHRHLRHEEVHTPARRRGRVTKREIGIECKVNTATEQAVVRPSTPTCVCVCVCVYRKPFNLRLEHKGDNTLHDDGGQEEAAAEDTRQVMRPRSMEEKGDVADGPVKAVDFDLAADFEDGVDLGAREGEREVNAKNELVISNARAISASKILNITSRPTPFSLNQTNSASTLQNKPPSPLT